MGEMIRNAPFVVFVLMVLFPLGMAGVLVFAGLRARRQAALVTPARSVNIGMADDGYRQFEGTAEAIGGHTLQSPLTGSACVWYEARVEELRSPRGSSGGAEWVTVRALTSSAPFVVRDATGACIVRVLDAEVTPRDKSRWIGRTLEPEERNPPRLAPQESWPMVETAGGSRRYRYTEQRIYAGDPLTVVGRFASHRFDATSDDGRDVLLDGETAEDLERDDDGAQVEPAPAGTSASASGAPAGDWAGVDAERQDALDGLAPSITRAEIAAGGRGQPLILAATSAATHAHMSAMGAQAAFLVALVPLGVAGLVLLARLG
jgi:hypothetical protein